MAHIIWRGQACFQIQISKGKGEESFKIVIDPFDETIGLRIPSLEAKVVLVSHNHPDHNNVKAVKGNPFLIDGPGEYEIQDIFFQGISSFHDDDQGKIRGENTIYTIEGEGIKICHLGDLGQKELTEEQLEKIGEVDVLMVPVGGIYTIDGRQAAKIISQIEPKIIIPMHYQLPKLKIKLEKLDKFLKAMGQKKLEPLPKLLIKKKDLTEEELKIVVLKP